MNIKSIIKLWPLWCMLFIVGIILEIEFLTNEKIITIIKNIIELTEKKVNILTKRRGKLVNDIAFTRQQSNSKSRLKKLLKQLKSVSDDLGPYYWHEKPFYLA